jgi:hypothetical protein
VRTVAEKWVSFERACVPQNASEAQRADMKRCFYAGALSALVVMQGIADDDLSDDAGAAVIEGLMQEVQAFSHGLIG